MEKKIPVKTLYLLFVISIGLVGLGVGSTYALFTADTKINDPITFTSNLTYSGEVMETIDITLDAGETVTSTLNIKNSTGKTINYTTWFVSDSEEVQAGITDTSSAPTGSLTSDGSTSVIVDIRNYGDTTASVTVGVSSSSDSVVLSNNMKAVPNAVFTAYAVYSADDNFLTFYNTPDTITVGNTYNGKVVTGVYTGFETNTYSGADVPWYSYRESINKVTVEEAISPVSTAYWFSDFSNCISMNLTKLDTSGVINMASMFNGTGYNATTFELLGLEKWDTSNVNNMSSMFYRTGYNATNWSLDLSKWNVNNVTSYTYFNTDVESKVTPPTWVS